MMLLRFGRFAPFVVLGFALFLFADVMASSAHAVERCRFERKRLAYPPGKPSVRVDYGSEKTPLGKFTERNQLFDALKKADGTTCQVNWTEAQVEINEWLADRDDVAMSEDRKKELEAKVGASAATVAVVSRPVAKSSSSCEESLLLARSRILELRSKSFNDESKRTAEVAAIVKLLEPCPASTIGSFNSGG